MGRGHSRSEALLLLPAFGLQGWVRLVPLPTCIIRRAQLQQAALSSRQVRLVLGGAMRLLGPTLLLALDGPLRILRYGLGAVRLLGPTLLLALDGPLRILRYGLGAVRLLGPTLLLALDGPLRIPRYGLGAVRLLGLTLLRAAQLGARARCERGLALRLLLHLLRIGYERQRRLQLQPGGALPLVVAAAAPLLVVLVQGWIARRHVPHPRLRVLPKGAILGDNLLHVARCTARTRHWAVTL